MNVPWPAVNAFSGQLAAFGWAVLWQSSLFIVAVWLIDAAIKRRVSGSVRYALWLLVLCKLLIPPSFAAPSGLGWWVRSRLDWVHATPTSSPVKVRYIVDANSTLLPETTAPRATLPAPGCSLATVGAAGSLAVTLLLVGCILYRQRQVTALVRRASPPPAALEEVLAEAGCSINVTARVRLRLSPDQVSPAVCGLLRPAIILPQSLATKLSGPQLRSVLLHELAHVRRGDVWVSCLQSLLQFVYWWHPLLWFANARIRRVREEAVDDAVVRALDDASPEYATTLVEVARLGLRRPIVALGFVGIFESAAMLKERIQRLVDPGTPRKTGLSILSLFCLAAFTAVALPMGSAPQPNTGPSTQDDRSLLHESQPGTATATNGATLKRGNQVLSADRIIVDPANAEIRAEGNVRLQTDEPPSSSDPLFTRVIKVDPRALRDSLLRLMGPERDGTNEMQRLREFFTNMGVDLRPPKTVFYKDREGWLLVRATAPDLQAIEQAIQQLNLAPAQIHASIKVAQLTAAKAAEFWAGVAPPQPTNKLAFLNKQEAARQLERLKAFVPPDQISEASVTTLSGRQTQIQIGDMLNILSRPSGTNSAPGTVLTNQVPVGYTIDLLPYAGQDGKSVQMTLSGNYTEFLGYDDPGQFVPQITGTANSAVVTPLPLPHFRVRNLKKSAVSSLDQQTVVVGGSVEIETDRVPVFGGDRPILGRLFRGPGQGEKQLILFITPTIIDAAGNPVNRQDR